MRLLLRELVPREPVVVPVEVPRERLLPVEVPVEVPRELLLDVCVPRLVVALGFEVSALVAADLSVEVLRELDAVVLLRVGVVPVEVPRLLPVEVPVEVPRLLLEVPVEVPRLLPVEVPVEVPRLLPEVPVEVPRLLPLLLPVRTPSEPPVLLLPVMTRPAVPVRPVLLGVDTTGRSTPGVQVLDGRGAGAPG